MRYYFNDEIVEFYEESGVWFIEKGETKKEVSLKEVSGKKFFSTDGLNWNKVIKMTQPRKLYRFSDEFIIHKGFRPSGQGGADEGSLISQMPGKIVKILAKVGDEIKKGDRLLILEAMKMENEIKASLNGKVIDILVSEGESIDAGKLMIEIEASEA